MSLPARLWAGWLAGALLVAGTHLYPSVTGRVVLAMIGSGFLLFALARISVAGRHAPDPCWSALGTRMRATYAAGYALMAGGTVLAVAASLLRLL
jgi:hypothetical protein